MKTLAGLLSIVLITASCPAAERPAATQPVQNDRPGVQLLERIRYSLGDLKLSDEQQSKVNDIFKNARESMDGMREKMRNLEPRERMAEGEKFFKSVRDELAAVLNKEQIEILDKKLDAAKENLRNRFGGQRGAPTTGPAAGPGRPGGAGGAGGPVRPGELMERFRAAIPKLNLDKAQTPQIRAIFEEVQTQGSMLRQQAEAGDEDARVKMRQLMEDTRTKLFAILKPDQQEKLKELMAEPLKPGAGAPGDAGRTRANPKTPATTQAMMMEGDDMMSAGERKSRKSGPSAQVGDPTKALVGTPAPPFALKKLDGSLVQLSALKGRVIVLEFGSYTCPAFRDRAAAMEKLKSDYSTRAQFFVVYTKEAHAKGEWEVSRNKDNEIIVEQPKAMDVRIDQAKKTREQLKLTAPILVDSMENETATAYGAGPNSAIVINRDGMIVAKQQWFDPTGLRRAIDEAAKATPTAATKPAGL